MSTESDPDTALLPPLHFWCGGEEGHTRLHSKEARGYRPHPEKPRSPLEAPKERSFNCLHFPSQRPCVELGPETEDSSPVLTWIFGYFWTLPRGVSPRLEWGNARGLSSLKVAAVSCYPTGGSRDVWLSL